MQKPILLPQVSQFSSSSCFPAEIHNFLDIAGFSCNSRTNSRRESPKMRKRASLIVLLFFASAALFACATTKKEGAPSSPEMKSRASYYDFEDVIIPAEMKLDSKEFLHLQHHPLQGGSPYFQRPGGKRIPCFVLPEQHAQRRVAPDQRHEVPGNHARFSQRGPRVRNNHPGRDVQHLPGGTGGPHRTGSDARQREFAPLIPENRGSC